MFERKMEGFIELICGSMFSGKSEELIRRVRRATYEKREVQVFKPMIDNRYSVDEVVSHNGNKVIAKPLARSIDIIANVAEQTTVVAIDEVQFFDEKIIEVMEHLADNGKRVIAAGLDQDFRGEPFANVATLMALAENVTKLHAVCTCCGAPASRTQRLIDQKPADYDEPIILIGAEEAYEARCRSCHIVLNKPTFLLNVGQN